MVEVVGDARPASTLSPSAINTFRNCGLQFFFSYVERWVSPPTWFTTLGEIVHDTLEQFYRLPPAERTEPAARALLSEVGRAYAEQDAHAEFARDGELADAARRGIANLFTLERPDRVAVAGDSLERAVTGTVGEVALRGRIDRVTDDGLRRVVDYKTGKVPPPVRRGKALDQVYLYAGMLRADDDALPVDEVELLYVVGGDRVRRPVTDRVLAGVQHRLTGTAEGITAGADAHRWPAIRSVLCNYCVFRPACPAMASKAPRPGGLDSQQLLVELPLQRRETTPPVEPHEPPVDEAVQE